MTAPVPLALLSAMAAAVLWGTTGTAQALGPAGTDPTVVGALRVAVGALVLLSLAVVTRRTGGTRKARQGPAGIGLLAVGGMAVAAYQTCFFLGVARSGVAVGTVVALGVAPLATGLLGTLLGERPDRRWVVSTAGAVVGIVLLVAGTGAGRATVDVVGLLAAVGAGLSYAGYTVAARALLLRGTPGVRVMAWFFTIAALLLLPALLGGGLGGLGSTRGAVMVLWLGVVATGLAYVLFQRGLAGLSAGTVATVSLAEPVTASLLGVLVLRERLSSLSVAGLLVVVVSLLAVAAGNRRPGMPAPSAGTARA